MKQILVETDIAAPIEAVFDLARSLRAHTASTASTGERVISPTDHDLLIEGDEVIFEAVHFGVRQRLTARIVAMQQPTYFRDELVRGAFKRLTHVHRFEPISGGTRMTDELTIEAPFGILGALAERLFLAAYMRRFLARRGEELRQMAEEQPCRES